MNFSEALKAMKMGSKVSRETWRGRISYWHIWTSGKGIKYIQQVKSTGEKTLFEAVVIDDILAEDWWIVT